MSERGKEVVVFESAQPAELHLARSLLEGAGIASAMRGGSASEDLEQAWGA